MASRVDTRYKEILERAFPGGELGELSPEERKLAMGMAYEQAMEELAPSETMEEYKGLEVQREELAKRATKRAVTEERSDLEKEVWEGIWMEKTGISSKEMEEVDARLKSELQEASRLASAAGKPEEYRNLHLTVEGMDSFEAIQIVLAFNSGMLEEVRGRRKTSEEFREALQKKVTGKKTGAEQLMGLGGMVAKGVVGAGGKGAVVLGSGLAPSRQKDLALYTGGKPRLDLYKGKPQLDLYQVKPIRSTPAPAKGFQSTMATGAHTRAVLEKLRMPLGTSADVSSVTSTMSKDMVLPRGWTKAMGAAYTEIRENGDTDTESHVKDTLEQQGISRGRTDRSIKELKGIGAVKGTSKKGETDQVLVITGTMTPKEDSSGKFGFKGTGRYKTRTRIVRA